VDQPGRRSLAFGAAGPRCWCHVDSGDPGWPSAPMYGTARSRITRPGIDFPYRALPVLGCPQSAGVRPFSGRMRTCAG